MFEDLLAYWRKTALETAFFISDGFVAEDPSQRKFSLRWEPLPRDNEFRENTIIGTEDADRLRGTSYSNDLMSGLGGDDTLDGGRGNDTIKGGSGLDHVIGNKNADVLYGGPGTDFVSGGVGRDWIDGGRGPDTGYLSGDQGADVLRGGEGDDYIWGDADGDAIGLDPGDDFLVGTSTSFYGDWDGEFDFLFDTGTYGAVRITIDLRVSDLQDTGFGMDELIGIEGVFAGEADDHLIGDVNDNLFFGFGGDDRLRGNEGNDILWGGRGRDELRGGAEADLLDGGGGRDMLHGGSGNDYLYGGEGADRLIGGKGIDTFIFYADEGGTSHASRDTVVDFVQGEDILALSGFAPGLVFTGTTAGAYSAWYRGIADGILLKIDTDGDALFDYKIKLLGLSGIDAVDLAIEKFGNGDIDRDPFRDQDVWQFLHHDAIL